MVDPEEDKEQYIWQMDLTYSEEEEDKPPQYDKYCDKRNKWYW